MMRRMRETQSEEMRQYYQQLPLQPAVLGVRGRARPPGGAGREHRAASNIAEADGVTVDDAQRVLRRAGPEGRGGHDRHRAAEGDPLAPALPAATWASATSPSTAPAPSLSGGEGQRIRLASQIGSELTGVIYVLDEPSIGLHQRDNRQAAGHAQAPARHRQHRRRRRARPRRRWRRRTGSSTSARARAATAAQVVAAGHARPRSWRTRTASPGATCRGDAGDRDPRARRRRGRPQDHRRGRAREQPQELDVGLPARACSSRHGRVAARARPRSSTTSSTRRWRARCYEQRRARGAHKQIKGLERRSTRSSTSTRARSAARRARNPATYTKALRPHPRLLRAACRRRAARLHARAASPST